MPHDRREHRKTDEDKIFRGKAGAGRQDVSIN